jgi:hypothetical protein
MIAANQVAEGYKERAAARNTMTLDLARWWRSTGGTTA